MSGQLRAPVSAKLNQINKNETIPKSALGKISIVLSKVYEFKILKNMCNFFIINGKSFIFLLSKNHLLQIYNFFIHNNELFSIAPNHFQSSLLNF